MRSSTVSVNWRVVVTETTLEGLSEAENATVTAALFAWVEPGPPPTEPTPGLRRPPCEDSLPSGFEMAYFVDESVPYVAVVRGPKIERPQPLPRLLRRGLSRTSLTCEARPLRLPPSYAGLRTPGLTVRVVAMRLFQRSAGYNSPNRLDPLVNTASSGMPDGLDGAHLEDVASASLWHRRRANGGAS